METDRDQTMTLTDGRVFGWSEYGDTQGRPVFYFHGWPASRKSGLQLDALGKRYRKRIIAPDRPGIGISTYAPNRTILDFAGDISSLCRYLSIRRFSVIGASGGAPYVYAVAYSMPRVIDHAVVVAGLGPLALLVEKRALPVMKLRVLSLSIRCVPLIPWFVSLHRALALHLPQVYSRVMFGTHSVTDKTALLKKQNLMMISETISEAYRQGARQVARDWQLYLSPWGFDPSEVTVPVVLFHGDRDLQVPYTVAKATAALSPNFSLRTFQGYGHYLLFTCGDSIFKTVFG